MTRVFIAGFGLVVLVGCGADGAPTRPVAEVTPSAQTGSATVSVSGYATVGVVKH